MQRISVLIGIGLMLVGALAYAMPSHPNTVALLPAFAGMVIALGGVLTLAQKRWTEVFISMNCIIALLLIIDATAMLCGLAPNLGKDDEIAMFVNMEAIWLSAIFLGVVVGFLLAKKNQGEKAG